MFTLFLQDVTIIKFYSYQAGIYMLKVSNEALEYVAKSVKVNNKAIKTSERRDSCRSGVFAVNFEQIS